MSQLTRAEEDHIKAVHSLAVTGKAFTKDIAERLHRLWETFLVHRLGLGWDEVHDIAEQLEHVSSEKLVERLDQYLEHPAFDPHGDPIPDKNGRVKQRHTLPLTRCAIGDRVRVVAVKEPSDALLHLLDRKGIAIGMLLE